MEPREGWKISFQKLLNILLFSVIFSSCLFVSLRPFRNPEPERRYSGPSAQTPQRPGNASAPPGGGRSLTILLWTWPFGSHFNFTECPELPGCPGCRCRFTTDRGRWRRADAVILHHRDVCGDRERLARVPRLPAQPRIWLNMESLSHSSNVSAMDNLFNLTMSYWWDSDVSVPLEQPRPLTVPRESELVAWVVSNWQEESRRVRYYQELSKHIPVDVYRKNHIPLPRDQLLPTISRCSFYLAFENLQHWDYITEKLWRSFVPPAISWDGRDENRTEGQEER